MLRYSNKEINMVVVESPLPQIDHFSNNNSFARVNVSSVLAMTDNMHQKELLRHKCHV